MTIGRPTGNARSPAARGWCRTIGKIRCSTAGWSRSSRRSEERPGAILVGHSLGALLIAHLAERHPWLPVAGALLVAPADADAATRAGRTLRDITAGGFSPMPLSPLRFPAVLAASRNDPYLGFARAHALARLWEARFVDLGAAGHVNVASGHGPWPDGLKLLEQVRALAALHGTRRTRPAERSGVVVPLAPPRLAAAAAPHFSSLPPPCRPLTAAKLPNGSKPDLQHPARPSPTLANGL